MGGSEIRLPWDIWPSDDGLNACLNDGSDCGWAATPLAWLTDMAGKGVAAGSLWPATSRAGWTPSLTMRAMMMGKAKQQQGEQRG